MIVGRSCLLDTNILIAFYNQDTGVLDNVAQNKIFIPSIVIGELWFGAEKSTRKLNNQKQIEALINEVIILPVSEETAKYYGSIKKPVKTERQTDTGE